MPDSTTVLTAVRNTLLAEGLIRRPADPGILPPLHIEPEDGPLGPGDRHDTDDPDGTRETDGDLVVTLRLSTTAPILPGEAGRRTYILDLVYKSQHTSGLIAGRALDHAIANRLIETASYGTGVMLDEGGPNQLFALSIQSFAGLGTVMREDGIVTEQAKLAVEISTA